MFIVHSYITDLMDCSNAQAEVVACFPPRKVRISLIIAHLQCILDCGGVYFWSALLAGYFHSCAPFTVRLLQGVQRVHPLGYAHFTTELKLGGPEQTRVGRVGDGRRESRLLTDGDETYWALAEGYLAPIGR